jgi:hypothetical protein
MNTPQNPTKAVLQGWLDAIDTEYHLCGECDGLHISELQSLEGVVDSRLFRERYGLLLTTEVEIRPVALLAVSADIGRLNMDYPTLKVFLDVVDDGMPQLVVAGILPSGGGVSRDQFAQFIGLTVEGVARLVEECRELDYLFVLPEDTAPPPSRAVH